MQLMAGAPWLQSHSGVRATVGSGPDVAPEDEAFAFRHAYCYAVSRLQANPAPRARIVVGTRLAVFASLPALALVVMDEEHDPSYNPNLSLSSETFELAWPPRTSRPWARSPNG